MTIEKRNGFIDIYVDESDTETELYAGLAFVEMAGCERLILESEAIIPEDVFEDIEITGMKLVKKGDYHVVYKKV